jgi:hypothetical protein
MGVACLTKETASVIRHLASRWKNTYCKNCRKLVSCQKRPPLSVPWQAAGKICFAKTVGNWLAVRKGLRYPSRGKPQEKYILQKL